MTGDAGRGSHRQAIQTPSHLWKGTSVSDFIILSSRYSHILLESTLCGLPQTRSRFHNEYRFFSIQGSATGSPRNTSVSVVVSERNSDLDTATGTLLR